MKKTFLIIISKIEFVRSKFDQHETCYCVKVKNNVKIYLCNNNNYRSNKKYIWKLNVSKYCKGSLNAIKRA